MSLPTYVFGSPSSPLGDDLAYIDAEEPKVLRLTWSTLRLWSQRFAAGLVDVAGFRQGDRLLVYSSNNVLVPAVFHGTLMAGGVYSAANARFLPRELAFQLLSVQPKLVLASRENAERAVEALRIAGIPGVEVYLFDHAPLETEGGGEDYAERKLRHWKHLLAPPEVARTFQWDELSGVESRRRTAGLLFSSGTTGLPKGVESSHYNVIANAVQVSHVMSLGADTPDSRWLCTIPLYHGLGLSYFMIIAPARRIPTFIMRQYGLDSMLTAIQRYKITDLHIVPPIVADLTKRRGTRNGRVDLSSVKRTFSCGAPLGPEMTLEYENLWPVGAMNVKQAFGMTELCGIALGCDPRTIIPPGSVGEPMPNVELKLVDDSGNEVKAGTPGELWLRCPNIMKGYWKNDAATADAVTEDGWLTTGDIAIRDWKGYYFIVDRKKEMIKVKGNQVAPAELEALLLEHPAVKDVAVIGVRSAQDESPRAYIVPSSPVSELEIHEHINRRVQSIKRLRGGVYFTDSIPKNASGKILRDVLRNLATPKGNKPKPAL